MDIEPEPVYLDNERNTAEYITCYEKYGTLISRKNLSKKKFEREYRQFCDAEWKRRGIYFVILNELVTAVSEGDVGILKTLSSFVGYVNSIEDRRKLRELYDSADSPLKSSNLIILACKYNKIEALKCVFSNKILNNLSVNIGRRAITFNEKDGAGHNAFYYSLRWNNVELLDTLIDKWPGDYADYHAEELDEALSSAYEELQLKNIQLSDEMQICTETRLTDLRFFSNTPAQNQSLDNISNGIKERVDFVIENINLLAADYSEATRVDERFIFVATCIAENIHILKQLWKSTYDRLPWDEMEFCLSCFICSRAKRQEINLFYRSLLHKERVLVHLKEFATVLGNQQGFELSNNYPQETRKKCISKIIMAHPEFQELYMDYRQLRDVYTLKRMNDYIGLALSVDAEQREGQLIITRGLQFVGYCAQNTTRYPNLSYTISKLLVMSVPEITRELILDFRNSPSQAYSHARRTRIQETMDASGFGEMQACLKDIGDRVAYVLREKKIVAMTSLLRNVTDAVDFDELAEAAEAFCNLDHGLTVKDLVSSECEDVEALVTELENSISEITEHEEMFIHEIRNIIGTSISREKHKETNDGFTVPFYMLKSTSLLFSSNCQVNDNVVRNVKFYAKEATKSIRSPLEPRDLQLLLELSEIIFCTVEPRMPYTRLEKIRELMGRVSHFVKYQTSDITWVLGTGGRLNKRSTFVDQRRHEERYDELLALRLTELTNILTDNLLTSDVIKNLSSYKDNKGLQSAIEALLLEILSILDSKHYLENNLSFFDDSSPLVTGKCLRDHLDHECTLLNLLLSDPSIAVLLNAKKLVSLDIINDERKLGKATEIGCSKFKVKYSRNLAAIAAQKGMFAASEEGSIESLRRYLQAGADMRARSINSWTALHFAAKGSSLETVRFLLDHGVDVNVRDVDGQTPLHIAAANGRTSIVKYFVEQLIFNVDVVDNNERTPLHVATENDHQDTVEALLANGAKKDMRDIGGNLPLHHAISNDNIDMFNIIESDASMNINQINALGYTPLHIATESGYFEMVNFLLKNNANVNGENLSCATPLHLATQIGQLKLVAILVLHGAKIDCRDMLGRTPLHYGVIDNHVAVVDILLAHGANVNLGEKMYFYTPLHYAAMRGYIKVLRILLKNNANAYITTFMYSTPLHFAAQHGYWHVTKVLIDHGVYVHSKDVFSATALYYASRGGYRRIVQLLVKNKAHIHGKTFQGWTALHAAAEARRDQVAEYLIDNKMKVNTRNGEGMTALHIAASVPDNGPVIDTLISRKAIVDNTTYNGLTPLHIAAATGCLLNVYLLVQYRANVNAKSRDNMTPLHEAVSHGHVRVVELLLNHQADVNARSDKGTPLSIAVDKGYKEIVKILLANENISDVPFDDLIITAIHLNYKTIVESLLIANRDNYQPEAGGSSILEEAIIEGRTGIVEMILRITNEPVNRRYCDGRTILHRAAAAGRVDIVDYLISKRADVNARSNYDKTPLHDAAEKGHDDVVELLITDGADVNARSTDGHSPLHLAVRMGHCNNVKILLNNGATIDERDGMNKTALEMAVKHGHLDIVKILLRYRRFDLNIDYSDSKLLHIASRIPNLELVRYLVDEGADVHGETSFLSKPIHYAANKDILQYFLSRGLSVDELDIANGTPLHYATQESRLECVEYLIEKGADVNAKSNVGTTPLHNAVRANCAEIVEILLKNGAMYNAADMCNTVAMEMAENNVDIEQQLLSIWKLFQAVKHDNAAAIELQIKAGAIIEAKDATGVTPLHFAASKGYFNAVKKLLEYSAKPNVISNGLTPLHAAAKHAHLRVAQILLYKSAIYNAASTDGKTPIDMATGEAVRNLLKTISDIFRRVKDDDASVVEVLNQIGDVEIIRAVMNARNEENRPLLLVAMHGNFSNLDELKLVPRIICLTMSMGIKLLTQRRYPLALPIFKSVYDNRVSILGAENLSTLDAQAYLAETYLKLNMFDKALTTYELLHERQTITLGPHDRATLKSKSMNALVLAKANRNEEALNLYQEVYRKQEELFGPDDLDTMFTQHHLGVVLERFDRYDEALDVYRTMFESAKHKFGLNNPTTLAVQTNIAFLLSKQKKCEEALEVFEEVLAKMGSMSDVTPTDTVKTLHQYAYVLFEQNRYQEALKRYKEIIRIQETAYGPNDQKVLFGYYHLIRLLAKHSKSLGVLTTCLKVINRMKAVFPSDHPILQQTLKILQLFNLDLNQSNVDIFAVICSIQKKTNDAASSGDIKTVQRQFASGIDLNDKDSDGRTPLYYAASNGHLNVLHFLLKNGADFYVTCNEGNTPLHAAAINGHKEVVRVLLQQVDQRKLSNFINARASATGNTPLHIAVSKGFHDVVCCLLSYGAMYSIKNRKGETPCGLSKNRKISDLFQLTDESFRDSSNGNIEIISKLNLLRRSKPDEFMAVTNARNSCENTLLQVAILKRHKHIANELIRILK